MPGIASYARIAGVLLLATAAVGLVGWDWGAASASYHAGLGLFFLFVGFSRLEVTTLRQLVGGFGVLLVLVGGVAILASWMLPMRYLHDPIEITSLIVGVASVLAASHLPDRRRKRK
jgi:hypothetical protein